MLKRLTYTAQMFLRYRRKLAEIDAQTPPLFSLLHLEPKTLKRQGVKILVLDFDGVLAAHGETAPSPQAIKWLGACIDEFGAPQMFILTNKPFSARLAYFRHFCPQLRLVKNVRKKPYPDGLYQIMEQTKIPPSAILIVDDRLLTGILAGCIARVQVAYIKQAATDFSRRPLQELFFMSLRKMERAAIKPFRAR